MKQKHILQQKGILVIGDCMLDIYCSGEVNRISPEAPVPVFRKLSERYSLGGAGNVAANLSAADQEVSIISVIGKDYEGELFLKELAKSSINADLIFRAQTRRTTIKTRFIASSNQQVFRMDTEDSFPLQADEYEYLTKMLEIHIHRCDLVIVSDYMKGLLTHEFTQKVIEIANKANVRTLIDVKDSDYGKYSNAFLLKPNLQELQVLTGRKLRGCDDIVEASAELCRLCKCSFVLATCGSRGMILTDVKKNYKIVESLPVEVYDVTGAGDTVIAYLAAFIARGLRVDDAVPYSNVAAGIQVTKSGTTPIHISEVYEWLQKNDKNSTYEYKIAERQLLSHIKSRNVGKKIVFTNGCFDILHSGHVKYLCQAASHGDILVVGLNSDDSVRRLKGKQRPIVGEHDRALLLASLEFVDYVVVFNEDTPYELISELMPDVLVKGSDYAPEDVVGKDILEQNGGKLVLIPFIEGKSTTTMLEKIRAL